jgi:CheY-like chemotaxis protein
MSDLSVKILLVDDDPSILKVLSDLMAIFGHEYVTASNGLDAVEKLKKESFHRTHPQQLSKHQGNHRYRL